MAGFVETWENVIFFSETPFRDIGDGAAHPVHGGGKEQYEIVYRGAMGYPPINTLGRSHSRWNGDIPDAVRLRKGVL